MLIARDGELEQIVAALGQNPLVTVTGPGGVGKTTLARAALSTVTEAGSTGLFVDLAPLDQRRFPLAVAGDLGFFSVEDLTEHVDRQLKTLIVFDNCEHVLDEAAEMVVRLLSCCPNLMILATSRERLDLPGELVVPVRPLPTDGPSSDARLLFETVCERHGVSDLGDPAVVMKLVERLDGLPLALELAAARTPAMTPSEILRHLDAKLDILSRARRRGPERHRSLQAAITWSFQLLTDDERRLLRRLSVVPPPFTQAIALAVGTPAGEREDIDALTRLVDQSLLVCEFGGGRSWYRMLDTIRTHASEQLTDGERADVEQQLVDLLEARIGKLETALSIGRAEPLTELIQMFRARVRVIDQLFEQGDVDRCVGLMTGLWWLEDSGHQGEIVDVIERVLTDRELSDDNAKAHAVLAAMYRITGREQEALALATAVASTGNDAARALAHRTLGLISRAEGSWSDAEHHFMTGADAAGLAGQEAVALEMSMHLALTRWRSGDDKGALKLVGELRGRSSGLPNVDGWMAVIQTVMYLGTDPAKARSIAEELMASDVAAADRWVAGWCSVDLGMVELLERGDDGLQDAARHVADGLAHFIAIRNRTDIVMPLLVASICAQRAGRRDEGRSIAATADHAYPQVVRGPNEQELLNRLGPLPTVDADHPRMSPDETVELLRRLATNDAPEVAAAEPAGPPNQLRPDGDGWVVSYRGRTSRIRDAKGVATLARLLARPNVEIAAIDLMDAAVVENASDVVADRTARDAYRERVRDLQVELDRATADNDPARAESARSELDRLVDELQAAYGLAGSERSTASTAERARSAVRWRIRDAIKRIEDVHPGMGAHLDRSISTGRFCSYRPVEPTVWRTE